jgi:hypothetical protein
MTEHGPAHLHPGLRLVAWPDRTPGPATRLAIAAYLRQGPQLRPGPSRGSPPSYADQNERDHRRLREAVDAGEIEAAEGF